VFQWGAEDCGKIVTTKANLTRHSSHDDPVEKRNRSIIPRRQMFQTVIDGQRQETVAPRQRMEGEANERPHGEDKVM
jgi:hypothetical protein